MYTYGLRELGEGEHLLFLPITREECHIWLAETVHENMYMCF